MLDILLYLAGVAVGFIYGIIFLAAVRFRTGSPVNDLLKVAGILIGFEVVPAAVVVVLGAEQRLSFWAIMNVAAAFTIGTGIVRLGLFK